MSSTTVHMFYLYYQQIKLINLRSMPESDCFLNKTFRQPLRINSCSLEKTLCL